jgi:putative PIN family toxin of toxin-antitoxin system
VVSGEILDEYVGVLKRPKFALPSVLQSWLDLIQARTFWVTSPPTVNFSRDPKDAPFLALAMATSADYLITGDRDLLQAQSLVQTRIVPPAEFAALFGIA